MSEPITIGIHTMQMSDNREEYFVFVRRGDREITPHSYRSPYRNRAEYEVAEWKHVLLGWPKPDLMDPQYADPKALNEVDPADKLVVVLEGGLVSHIAGTGIMVGRTVHVIDYDTDGATIGDSELYDIEQSDGSTTTAYFNTETVGEMTITLPTD
ncbi:hypothetical protein [Mesorhizobium sp. M4B.F.Ca.ET.058.02.1.1]|uniref:hypothetical protein n=1 Tax=Mesorhizobium sp. M4B.F.Ca.ET.058.02.1.1 TaxID=2493675 RepID=UPI000F7622DE|nr:hypothetical protein [Mesorhizobium sp. M4B.F.Ca.ET.058.02.1.1]AZO48069.1 hypothetical protein EJ073_09750 [Mesorhizobium sp. M4B.F.Ca.ET.058.02.1.1]